ncbi:MAG: bacillithiol biosynthesis cysteine-adding enzyme BshC [Ferruginibacter sp.]
MNFTSTAMAYRETGFYSRIIADYLDEQPQLQAFYAHPVSVDGIKAAVEARRSFATNRKLLVETLQKHYKTIPVPEKVKANIHLLLSENTFTVTTAHQPNIFTGHLYFIYKILHVIRLSEKLKIDMPGNDFVPVFYMGSEDADLEELGHVYINGQKQVWNTTQTGAVGRMKVDKALISLLDVIAGEITVHPHGKDIIELMKSCYLEGTSIEQATFKLINSLFGEYGLLVLLPDDAGYKKAFIPVLEKELTTQFSHGLVAATVAAFPKEYKVQTGGRELNLFYLKDDARERIEKRNGQFTILNAGTSAGVPGSFTEPEMLEELKSNPERFSPNVILRPVFQEMILPNIAFIGGGGEIGYWLELKKVFEAAGVPFPVLVLRNSFMLVEKKHAAAAKKLGFTGRELFTPEQDLMQVLVKRESEVQLSLEKEKQAVHEIYRQIKNTAGAVDITLQPHTEALEKLSLKKIDALEKKLLRAEKKKFEAHKRQLQKLRSQLFPLDNLQERIENFMPFYAKWGKGFIGALYIASLSLEQEFMILEEE